MKLLASLLLLAASCFAQTAEFGRTLALPAPSGTFYSTTDEITHGGFDVVANFGANVGDVVEVDVKCDHTGPDGLCFQISPQLVNCRDGLFGGCNFNARVPFTLKENSPGKQSYQVSVLSQGDNFVTAAYFWIGTQVHYWIHMVSTETLP